MSSLVLPIRGSVAAAVIAASLLLVACGSDAPEQTIAETPAVGVIEATLQKVNPFFEFVGKTRAKQTVALRARVTGFLEAREFEEGGDVEKGQVLFKIEPEQYQASLAQTEAELAAAKASLNRAQVDLKRYKELAKAKNVSQQEVDKTAAEVLVQEASVQTAEAAIRKAQLNVDYTEIVAPIAGRIDAASYTVGNLVGPESGIMATINLMEPIHVVFSIAETWYLELVKDDIDVRESGGDLDEFSHVPLIRLPNGALFANAKGDVIEGRFDFIDNKVDEKTGTVLVRAVFDNPELLLLPGTFVTVVIERKEAKEAVLIPQAAALTDQGGYYVLIVDAENKVQVRRIETGQRFDANWVVEKGLEPGDRIILHGVQKVRPGIEVKPEVVEATPMPSMADAAVESVDDKAATDANQGSDAAADEAAESAADAEAGEDAAEQRNSENAEPADTDAESAADGDNEGSDRAGGNGAGGKE